MPVKPMNDKLLKMQGIYHYYGLKTALSNVDFELNPGEIHGLVGDHRAGKSTLIKLLCGALRCRQGQIILPTGCYESLSPRKALSEGIGVVFQQETLVPSLNAIDNIFSGQYHLHPGGIIQYKKHSRQLQKFCMDLNLEIDISKPVDQLDKVNQHLVEFLRAIYFDPSILILDEISSRFTPREMDLIYEIILKMKNDGKSIVYISHDMDEIMEFADRVTILREGHCRKTEEIRNLDKMQLYYMTYSHELSRKELRQANLDLYNFKRYNEAIIRNIPLGVVILDNENQIYQINQSAKILLSILPDEDLTLGKIMREIPADAARILNQAIDRKRQKHMEAVSYGKEIICDILSVPFNGDDGETSGTILLFENKTSEVKFKNYLLQTKQISSIAELAAGIAHEINNPLNIILNYLDLLSLSTDDELSKSRLQKIEKEILRITEITGGLLSFSRVKQTEMELIDLRKVYKEAMLLLNYKLDRSGIELKYTLPAEAVIIRGNFNKLEQILINLVMNAMEVLEQHGIISIEIKPETERILFMVKDNGPGVSEGIKDEIFSPFFTTKLEEKNSGLGLSVSMHIMSEHHGRISYSRENEMTVFTLEFPLPES